MSFCDIKGIQPQNHPSWNAKYVLFLHISSFAAVPSPV